MTNTSPGKTAWAALVQEFFTIWRDPEFRSRFKREGGQFALNMAAEGQAARRRARSEDRAAPDNLSAQDTQAAAEDDKQ